MHEGAEGTGPRGPGYRLREARTRRGLSVIEVARNLRLDPKIITAMEADDYPALPAPLFVKGYLNQYCRLLGLPGDECVAEYERGIGGVAPPPLVVRRGAGDEIAPEASPVLAITLLVAALAVVMVVLWWFARTDAPPPEPAAVTRSAPPPVAATVELEAQQSEPEVDPPPPVATAPVERATVELTRVRLEFREESWTEVVDADGRRLFFDLARAGTAVEVRGVAPISVFLGNAPSVRITVDGLAFDQSRFVRSGNVARFTLGGDHPPAARR